MEHKTTNEFFLVHPFSQVSNCFKITDASHFVHSSTCHHQVTGKALRIRSSDQTYNSHSKHQYANTNPYIIQQMIGCQNKWHLLFWKGTQDCLWPLLYWTKFSMDLKGRFANFSLHYIRTKTHIFRLTSMVINEHDVTPRVKALPYCLIATWREI